MKLYHGSSVVVTNPRVLTGGRALDFGAGFYLTSDEAQAVKWALSVQKRRRAQAAFLNCYEWQCTDALTILEFDKPDEQWLDFVVGNRQRQLSQEHYDIVIGPVANDTTLAVIDDYMDGRYTKEEAIRRLLPQKLTDQYAFLTQRGIDSLEFKESIEL